MTRFEVQYVLPVNDPVNNIGVFQRKKFLTFLVPINHPNAHNIGLQDLLAAVERQELLGLSTPLNNKSLSETLKRYYRYGQAQKKETARQSKDDGVSGELDEGTVFDGAGSSGDREPESGREVSSESDPEAPPRIYQPRLRMIAGKIVVDRNTDL